MHQEKQCIPSQLTENSIIFYLSRELQDIIIYLITKNSDVNQRHRRSGNTPLHVGVASKSSKVVGALLRAGADVNRKNRQGFTPLHVAAAAGSMEIVGELLEKDAEINAQVWYDTIPGNLAFQKGRYL